jgi:hypothetical protein
MSNVVQYRPITLVKYPVMAVPTPINNSDTIARVCSRIKTKTKTTANARKPGISRMLCRIPNSLPLNPATSMVKLLIIADQVANESGTADAISISNISGERKYSLVALFNDFVQAGDQGRQYCTRDHAQSITSTCPVLAPSTLFR